MRMKSPRTNRVVVLLLLVGLLPLLAAVTVMAEPPTDATQAKNGTQSLELDVGKSTIIDLPVPIKRASLANPEIADAIVLSPRQIYVTGKGFGATNLTLWDKKDQILTTFDIQVNMDISRLKDRLSTLLPDESRIEVVATHDHVTLSGMVSSSERLNQAVAVAEAYAPQKVINFLGVDEQPVEPTPTSVTVEVIKGTAVTQVTPK